MHCQVVSEIQGFLGAASMEAHSKAKKICARSMSSSVCFSRCTEEGTFGVRRHLSAILACTAGDRRDAASIHCGLAIGDCNPRPDAALHWSLTVTATGLWSRWPCGERTISCKTSADLVASFQEDGRAM